MSPSLLASVIYIGEGLGMTAALLAGSLTIGFTLGGVLGILRHRGIATHLINVWISVLRGVPMILQLSLVFFSFPGLLGLHPSILQAGIIALGLNSSAYMAEIFRSGINSVPKGQFEAAKVLAIPTFYLWRDIVLPQALSVVWPAFINETISLLKETALIGTIGGMDIMRLSKDLGAETYVYFAPLCIAGAYYYTLSYALYKIGNFVQKKYFSQGSSKRSDTQFDAQFDTLALHEPKRDI